MRINVDLSTGKVTDPDGIIIGTCKLLKEGSVKIKYNKTYSLHEKNRKKTIKLKLP